MSDLLKINVSEHTERALRAAYGGEWKEHTRHASYWFSNAGLCARVKIGPRIASYVLLAGCQSGRGYRAISCPIGGGKYERIYIHRAVCELFNGEAPFSGAQVRHLDCNMYNNNARNLAWGTPKENAMDSVANGRIRRGTASPYAKLEAHQVRELRRLRALGLSYYALGQRFGIARMTAQRICTKEHWQ